jgi:hypothetical protein
MSKDTTNTTESLDKEIWNTISVLMPTFKSTDDQILFTQTVFKVCKRLEQEVLRGRVDELEMALLPGNVQPLQLYLNARLEALNTLLGGENDG